MKAKVKRQKAKLSKAKVREDFYLLSFVLKFSASPRLCGENSS
jgi:hypothetical protein